MSNYSVSVKNSVKPVLKKIKQSQLKSQFLKIVKTLKENPYFPNQSFEKFQPKHL